MLFEVEIEAGVIWDIIVAFLPFKCTGPSRVAITIQGHSNLKDCFSYLENFLA